jgi:ribosomal protein S18 acetylase RimI-like enzyme
VSSTGLDLRPLGRADIPAIVALANACDVAEIGEPDTDDSDVARDIEVPNARWFGVDAPDGELVAFARAVSRPQHLALDGDVRVRPGGPVELGPPLLAEMRRAAAELDPSRPVHAFVHVRDAVRASWFAAAGGKPVRHFWRMSVDLQPDVAAPPPPAGVVIRTVRDDDADKRAVFDLVQVAFAEHFGHNGALRDDAAYEDFLRRTHDVSGFDLALWWVAEVDGVLAAALLGRELPDAGLVNTLGTLAEFRGRGLGRSLLRTAFAEFGGRGLPRALLYVDASNPTGAVALYESVGMRTEHEWVVYEVPPLASPEDADS